MLSKKFEKKCDCDCVGCHGEVKEKNCGQKIVKVVLLSGVVVGAVLAVKYHSDLRKGFEAASKNIQHSTNSKLNNIEVDKLVKDFKKATKKASKKLKK